MVTDRRKPLTATEADPIQGVVAANHVVSVTDMTDLPFFITPYSSFRGPRTCGEKKIQVANKFAD